MPSAKGSPLRHTQKSLRRDSSLVAPRNQFTDLDNTTIFGSRTGSGLGITGFSIFSITQRPLPRSSRVNSAAYLASLPAQRPVQLHQWPTDYTAIQAHNLQEQQHGRITPKKKSTDPESSARYGSVNPLKQFSNPTLRPVVRSSPALEGRPRRSSGRDRPALTGHASDRV